MSQATALLADAESSISSGAWDQALLQLESLKKSEPGEPDVYRRLAHVQAIRGKFRSVIESYVQLIGVLVAADQLPEAESVIRTVLSLSPECEEAREKRIEIEKRRGNVDRAVYLARELARLCIEQGDGDRSIRLLQEAQKEQPENLDISLELAEMFVSHGQIQDGANQYRKVANALQEVGNIAKAAEAYRRMKVVQSDDPEVLLTLGRLYTELGKLDEAEQEFRSVLRHDLEHQDALMELGLVCQLKGRFRSGLLAFNKVLQNNPTLPTAMRKLGELNLSMGKQDEAIQHLLESAQSFLASDDREQAIEVFQIVLGVDEGNAQAQQGLTNLGAPLEPKEFVPPLPPNPPEDEPPTPVPVPVSAFESMPEPPPSAAAAGGAVPSMEENKPSKGSGSGAATLDSSGRRKGLVAGGGGMLRKGLVDPTSGGKPMMGGKPALGGGGSTRAGLRRPGLGMKGGPGGDKPMMGMAAPSAAAKPTLDRRSFEAEAELDSEIFDESEDFAGESLDMGAMESLFDDQSPAEEQVAPEFVFESGGDDLFGDAEESPFGGGLGDSLFSSDEPDEVPPSAPGPVIGSFSSSDAGESGGVSGELRPFAKAVPTEGSLAADDLFDMGGGDLFGQEEPIQSAAAAEALFDDEPLSGGDLFGDEPSGGGGLFDDLSPPPKAATVEPSPSSSDLFAGEQFDNLFDDAEQGSNDPAASDTIGSFRAENPAGLFDQPQDTSSAGTEDVAFDSLFNDEEESAPAGVSFFDEVTEQSPPSEAAMGLFDEPAGGQDLFGDDLFSTQLEDRTDSFPAPSNEREPINDDLFSGDDLFGSPEEAPQAVTHLFDDEPPAEVEDEPSGGLFDDLTEGPQDGMFVDDSKGTDLFGDDDLFGGPAEGHQPEELEVVASSAVEDEFDLFSEPDEVTTGQSHPPAQHPLPEDGLFDGFDEPADERSLFPAAEGQSASTLFDEPAESNLFDEGGDDLFSSEVQEEMFPVASITETVIDHPQDESLEAGGDDLFGGMSIGFSDEPQPSSDMFDIPDPGAAPVGVDDSLFDELDPADDGGGLFDEEPVEFVAVESVEPEAPLDFGESNLFESGPLEEIEPAVPLDLDLPMPGDPPLTHEGPLVEEPGQDVGEDDLFGSGDPFAEVVGPESDSLTLDQLRAEEMARVVDAPIEDTADSPEFMKLLELTLPKAEEEVPEEILSDAESGGESSLFTADGEADLFDQSSAGNLDGDLFDSSQDALFETDGEGFQEPEAVDEGPDILGKPKVSLSIEDESSTGDIDRANRLDASLSGADVAARIAGYRKALEETPENLVMRTRLADIHLKYGMLEDALVQYRQVIKRNSDSISLLHRVIQAEFWNENYAEACEALLMLAKLHLKRGEHHDALDTLQSVLSLDFHHFEARKVLVSVFTILEESKLAAHHLRQLAETALTKGEVDEAISAFQQLLEISNDPVFEERLAQIYESQGEMELALRSFQSLVGRYQQEERWEEAARVTERIVELNPELLDDRGALVDLYKKLGMSHKAMEQQFKLARLYHERGDVAQSVQLFEGVLIHQPDNQDARRLLVDAYLDSNSVSAALEQAEALTEHYLDTKDHLTAIALYERLVEADPENVELQERLVKFYGLAGDPESARVRWVGLADLHESKSRFDRAAEAIQRALELDESQIELQHRLALLYAEKLGDKVSALTQLRKLFQIAPDRLDAVKMYIEILLSQQQVAEAGQVLQRMEAAGGESRAIKIDVITSLRNRAESNPGDFRARFDYGELCYHLGDLDHAIEQFQQTRRNPEFELMSYNMLGLCFAKKKGFNMLDLAIKQFKKGLETRGHTEQSYLELRYNLATIQYQNGRIAEALSDFKECYRVDIAYRDVRSWIEKIESELASSGS